MDNTLTTALAGLSAIAIGAGLYYRMADIEESRQALASINDRIEKSEAAINGKQAELQAISLSEDELKKTVGLMKTCQTAGSQVTALKFERKQLADQFLESVQLVRQKAAQVVVPELMLKDGSRLINAKVRKVDQSGVSFIHDGGVTLVNEQLPDLMRARLRPDVNALFAEIRTEDVQAPKASAAPVRKPVLTFQQKLDAIPPGTEVLEFYADWCGPCKAIKSQVEKFAVEISPKVRLTRVNFDSEKEMVARFGVRVIPTFIVLRNGQVVTRRVGGISIPSMRKMIGL